MRPSQTDKVTVVLAILCVLTGAIAWYAEMPESRGREAAAPASNAPNGGNNLDARPDRASDRARIIIDHYAEILDRPLFSLSRRPAAELDAGLPDAGLPSRPVQTRNSKFELAGIIIIEGKRFALLRTANGRVTRRVEVGDEIDGWRVASVTPDSATLDRGVQSKTIELERKGDPRLAAIAKQRATRRRAQAKGRGEVRGAPQSITPDRIRSSTNNGSASSGSSDNDNEDEDEDEDEDDND